MPIDDFTLACDAAAAPLRAVDNRRRLRLMRVVVPVRLYMRGGVVRRCAGWASGDVRACI